MIPLLAQTAPLISASEKVAQSTREEPSTLSVPLPELIIGGIAIAVPVIIGIIGIALVIWLVRRNRKTRPQ